MRIANVFFVVGLLLFVAGYGGAVEYSLIGQRELFGEMVILDGDINPREIAATTRRDLLYPMIGIPIGSAGVVLLCISFRMYILSVRDTDPGEADQKGLV